MLFFRNRSLIWGIACYAMLNCNFDINKINKYVSNHLRISISILDQTTTGLRESPVSNFTHNLGEWMDKWMDESVSDWIRNAWLNVSEWAMSIHRERAIERDTVSYLASNFVNYQKTDKHCDLYNRGAVSNWVIQWARESVSEWMRE